MSDGSAVLQDAASRAWAVVLGGRRRDQAAFPDSRGLRMSARSRAGDSGDTEELLDIVTGFEASR
jgi:hypothetical protein